MYMDYDFSKYPYLRNLPISQGLYLFQAYDHDGWEAYLCPYSVKEHKQKGSGAKTADNSRDLLIAAPITPKILNDICSNWTREDCEDVEVLYTMPRDFYADSNKLYLISDQIIQSSNKYAEHLLPFVPVEHERYLFV